MASKTHEEQVQDCIQRFEGVIAELGILIHDDEIEEDALWSVVENGTHMQGEVARLHEYAASTFRERFPQ